MPWKATLIIAPLLVAILLTLACVGPSNEMVLSPAEPAPQADQPTMILSTEATPTEPTSSPSTQEQARAPATLAIPAAESAV